VLIYDGIKLVNIGKLRNMNKHIICYVIWFCTCVLK
jgi:hypothetical protein